MLDTPELKQSGIIKEVHWNIHSVVKLAGSQQWRWPGMQGYSSTVKHNQFLWDQSALKKTSVSTLVIKQRPLHIFILILNGYYIKYMEKQTATTTKNLQVGTNPTSLLPTMWNWKQYIVSWLLLFCMAYDQQKQIRDYWPTDDMAQRVMITPGIQEVFNMNYG